MRSYVVVLALLSVLVVACAASDEELFLSFMQKYKKSYSSEEFNNRLAIFKNNLKIAADLDSKDAHADYGVTKFMDLSPQEFREYYLIKNFTSPKKEGKNVPTLPRPDIKGTIPVAFDWNAHGAVTAVYNQGQCGSCWAFSTTENVESMWAISGRGLRNLAMQQLVDCDHMSDGCGGGNPPNAYQYIIQAGGMDSYGSYPYAGVNQACSFRPADVAAKIGNWGYITTTDDVTAMLEWTYSRGPPSVCVDAELWQYYTGGVVTGNCGTQMDHCVQITGYQTIDGIPAWDVRNSWGTDFGYGGYIFIMRGANVCLIGNEVTSSVI